MDWRQDVASDALDIQGRLKVSSDGQKNFLWVVGQHEQFSEGVILHQKVI